MKLSLLNHNHVGEVLALPIYNSLGICFIKEGSTLSSFIIDKLINMGCSSIYLESPIEIVLEQALPTTVHFELSKRLKDLFGSISKSQEVDPEQIAQITKQFMEQINLSENSIFLPNPTQNDPLSAAAEHCLEVAIYTARIAIQNGVSRDRMATLITAALLHDIGKLIDDSPMHMQKACDMLRANTAFGPTLYISILHMYENIDGSGPFGIKEDTLFENAQIIHLANLYSQLLGSSDSPNEAIEKLSAESSSKFSLNLFRNALKNLYCYPNGLVVKLSSGACGTVVCQNPGMPSRPVIMLESNERIDLSMELTTFIEQIIL